jgi:hypothetical protein
LEHADCPEVLKYAPVAHGVHRRQRPRVFATIGAASRAFARVVGLWAIPGRVLSAYLGYAVSANDQSRVHRFMPAVNVLPSFYGRTSELTLGGATCVERRDIPYPGAVAARVGYAMLEVGRTGGADGDIVLTLRSTLALEEASRLLRGAQGVFEEVLARDPYSC